MEAGSAMFEFYSALFDRVSSIQPCYIVAFVTAWQWVKIIIQTAGKLTMNKVSA